LNTWLLLVAVVVDRSLAAVQVGIAVTCQGKTLAVAHQQNLH
jgi:hypothetical protein